MYRYMQTYCLKYKLQLNISAHSISLLISTTERFCTGSLVWSVYLPTRWFLHPRCLSTFTLNDLLPGEPTQQRRTHIQMQIMTAGETWLSVLFFFIIRLISALIKMFQLLLKHFTHAGESREWTMWASSSSCQFLIFHHIVRGACSSSLVKLSLSI